MALTRPVWRLGGGGGAVSPDYGAGGGGRGPPPPTPHGQDAGQRMMSDMPLKSRTGVP
jgi:hypothetical protein